MGELERYPVTWGPTLQVDPQGLRIFQVPHEDIKTLIK